MAERIDIPEEDDTTPRLLVGDFFEQIKRIPDKSINCIITSPPYWEQRDYNVEGQIGNEDKPEEYIKKIIRVGSNLKRVLKDDGVFFLNLGDKYVDKDLLMLPERIVKGMKNDGWVLRNKICWDKIGAMPSPFEDRFSNEWEPIYMFVKDVGPDYVTPKYKFFLDRVRVPHKTEGRLNEYNPKEILNDKEYERLPSSIKGKEKLPFYISEEEYKKLPEKLKEKSSDYDGKFEKADRKNIGASPGVRTAISGACYSGPYRKHDPDELKVIKYLRKWKDKAGLTMRDIAEKTGIKKTTIEHYFRTDRGSRCLPSPENWEKLKDVLGFDDKYDKEMTETHYKLSGTKKHPEGRNPGDVWEMKTGKVSEAHVAVFSEDIPERAIKSACPKKGVVLDPFGGSGTTSKVAKKLGRRSIMIEIDKEDIDIIRNRCGKIKIV